LGEQFIRVDLSNNEPSVEVSAFISDFFPAKSLKDCGTSSIPPLVAKLSEVRLKIFNLRSTNLAGWSLSPMPLTSRRQQPHPTGSLSGIRLGDSLAGGHSRTSAAT